MQRTLILFKPDAVQRRLAGKLLTRLEEKGLKIVGLKMLMVTKELSKQHYSEHVLDPSTRCWKNSSPPARSSPWSPVSRPGRPHDDGSDQRRGSRSGTIRGDYGVSRQMNLMHGGDVAPRPPPRKSPSTSSPKNS
ncbi:MAG: nucleoside-diphosphate kinase [Planctomycetales bacterium]